MSLMLMDIKPIFFYAAMIQSVGSGVVAGVFEAGTLEAGAKHAFILLAVSWFAFKFLVGI
ncbi:MAG TPA: hypothetical protein ENI45_03770 [Thermoplasmatales archaeon]|nr:hypothetical protein [Thermoplasmatales archaeon]